MNMFKKTIFIITAFTTVFILGTATVKAADFNSTNGKWTTVSKTRTLAEERNINFSGLYWIDHYTSYIKFKSVATGKLNVHFYLTSGFVALCNAKKKVIATTYIITNIKNHKRVDDRVVMSKGADISTDEPTTFAVKKNRTYYIRVYGCGVSNSIPGSDLFLDLYKIKPVNTKFSVSRHGSKKSKAKTIKRNKAKKGLIIAGSSKKDWYKLKIKKKKSIKFYIHAGTNSSLNLTMYKKNGKRQYLYYRGGLSSGSFDEFNRHYPFTTRKLEKGTYYIKVQKCRKSCGWYSIKWNYAKHNFKPSSSTMVPLN